MSKSTMRTKIRKRREPKSSLQPGRAILPEDLHWVNSRSTLKAQPDRRPAPRVVSTGRVLRSDVERRLLTAMKTLRAMPDRNYFIMRSSSPDYVREAVTAYGDVEEIAPRYQPTPADISDCLTALSWVRHLEKSAWRLIWWRSFDLSFGLIAKYIGKSDETARKRFENAITDAWIAANG